MYGRDFPSFFQYGSFPSHMTHHYHAMPAHPGPHCQARGVFHSNPRCCGAAVPTASAPFGGNPQIPTAPFGNEPAASMNPNECNNNMWSEGARPCYPFYPTHPMHYYRHPMTMMYPGHPMTMMPCRPNPMTEGVVDPRMQCDPREAFTFGRGRGGFPHGGSRACSLTRGCKDTSSVVPVLTYFDAEGLGEAIRLTFKIGNVPFVDRRITHEDWPKHFKNYSPSGRAPFLEVGGEIIVESVALMHYAARRAGLMPETAEDELRANMAVEWIYNYRNQLAENITEPPADVKDVAAYRQVQVAPLVEKALQFFEKLFAEWGVDKTEHGYLVGNRLSYADVLVAGGIDVLKQKQLPNDETYPVLSKIWRNVWQHPRVVDYARTRALKAAKPILHRFANQSISLPIVWAFALGQIEFEDRVFHSLAEWETKKELSPSGKLPVLEVGGDKYVESEAILMYVAKLAGLVPACDFGFAKAVSVVKQASGIRQIMRASYIKDEAAKKLAIEKANYVLLPEAIDRLEEVVSKTQDVEGHVVGHRISFADLWLAQVYHDLAMGGVKGFRVEQLNERAPRTYRTYKMVMGCKEVQKVQQQQTLASKPVLIYFDVAGRAEPCRLTMLVAGIEFEDRRISAEEFKATYKPQSPTGQVPYLEFNNGKKLAESKAILTWVTEVAPSVNLDTAEQRVLAESLAYSMTRLDNVLMPYYYGPEEKKEQAKVEIIEKTLPAVLELWEKLWASTSSVVGVSVGDHTSWIDTALTGVFCHLMEREFLQADWKKTYPTLAAVYAKVISHPSVSTYRASLKTKVNGSN